MTLKAGVAYPHYLAARGENPLHVAAMVAAAVSVPGVVVAPESFGHVEEVLSYFESIIVAPRDEFERELRDSYAQPGEELPIPFILDLDADEPMLIPNPDLAVALALLATLTGGGLIQ